MKVFLPVFVFLSAIASQACPDLNGEYFFKDHPWNGKIIVHQQACDSLSLTFKRKVTPSPSNPSGDWEFTTNYKPNGVPYKGMYQADTPAEVTDFSFHLSQFVDQGISITEFEGSQESCALKHSFGDITGKCKKYEIRLQYLPNLKSFVWEQIGFGWNEQGWSDEMFPLEKR